VLRSVQCNCTFVPEGKERRQKKEKRLWDYDES
jgi:hypothetical protein